MGQLREAAEHIIDETLKHPGVTGAIIATRDGLPALGSAKIGDQDVIVAMAAASLAAAETTALEAGAGPVDEVMSICGQSKVRVCGLDNDHLLIVVSMDDEGATAMDSAREQLQEALAE